MKRDEELAGFFDQGVKFTGEMEFENTFRIDGVFSGKIKSNDTLIIGEKGSVDGEVEAGVVSVIGTVRGKIRARQRLEIQKGGKVFADINTVSLLIVEGGIFQGNCEMDFKGQEGAQVLEWKSKKG